MTTSIGSLSTYSTASAGKLYVPVSKNALLYSHFKNVSGVAAKNGQSGVPITKIQILNSIIERLSNIKNEPKISINSISDERADQLIKNFQAQIQQAVKSPYALSGVKAEGGDIVSLLC